MPNNNSSDIYKMLDGVRQRRSMYLRRKSLIEIETMCHGYAMALHAHSIRESGKSFNRDFGDYLERRFGWSTCQGWACAIRDHSRSSSQAFDRFFVLLDEFRKSRA